MGRDVTGNKYQKLLGKVVESFKNTRTRLILEYSIGNQGKALRTGIT